MLILKLKNFINKIFKQIRKKKKLEILCLSTFIIRLIYFIQNNKNLILLITLKYINIAKREIF